jgi:hypothetical protein
MYPSRFGHFRTCVYMSYRSNESFIPKQQRKYNSAYPWNNVGGRVSDKNVEQRTNSKLCVKIGKSASETLALLTLVYGEYAIKKSSDLK